ncbi:MAG TPA: sulfotransferase family protein [Prochlorococcus sp.]
MAGKIVMIKAKPTAKDGVFLLGVGAQKAGTSWLHLQLHSRPDANFGFCKEYHIHDALTVPKLIRYRQQHGSWLKPRTMRRQRFFSKPNRYYDYFCGLLRRRHIRLTGDITPSYSCLSANTLTTIKSEFSQRGIPVRPVFLMRDPVERIISSQRMKLRKRGQRNQEEEIQALRSLVNKLPKRFSIRSNYAHTLNALQEAFGHENCFIGFYETLFTKESYSKLCNFVDISYKEPNWQQKVNVSATSNLIPDDILQELGAWQAPMFQAVKCHFPDLKLESIWPTASTWCTR